MLQPQCWDALGTWIGGGWEATLSKLRAECEVALLPGVGHYHHALSQDVAGQVHSTLTCPALTLRLPPGTEGNSDCWERFKLGRLSRDEYTGQGCSHQEPVLGSHECAEAPGPDACSIIPLDSTYQTQS